MYSAPWKSSLQTFCLFKSSTWQTVAASSPLMGWVNTDQADHDFYYFFELKGLNSTPRYRARRDYQKSKLYFLWKDKTFLTCTSQVWCTTEKWTEMPNGGVEMLHSVSLHNATSGFSDAHPHVPVSPERSQWFPSVSSLHQHVQLSHSCGVPAISDGVQVLLLSHPAFREQVAAATLQVLLQCGRDVGSAGEDIFTTWISLLPPPC